MYGPHVAHLLGISWGWLCIGPLVAVLLLLFVLLPVAIFAAALFEKVHLRQLRPAEPAKAEASGARTHPTVTEAAAAGYASLGVFSDGDRGLKEGILTLMLSPDRRVLLWVLHGKLAGRHRLITRSADGHWLVTSSVTAVRDLSGLLHEKMLADVPLPVIEIYHRERAARWNHPVATWAPATVAEDVLAFERSRVERMVAGGTARYIVPGHVYRYRLAGAARVTLTYLGEIFALAGETGVSDARKRDYAERRPQWAPGLVTLPDGSVRADAPGSSAAPDLLGEVATDPARREEFVRILAERGAYVVMRSHGGTPGHIDYVEGGVNVYPLFSSPDRAADHVRRLPYGQARGPFHLLYVEPDWLLGEALARFKLVLNPHTGAETVITPADLDMLREVVALSEPEPEA